MLNLPDKITICEVGPRDGLQSLDKWIETETKIKMIDMLSAAGFPVIEVTGFTRSNVIPNLKDSEEVCARIARKPGTVYRALVPNARGTERALDSKLDELLGLITVSETYLRKNQNMSLTQAIEEGIKCFRMADQAGTNFVMAVGAALWCAYEGEIPQDKTLSILHQFYQAGISNFYIAGSMGVENPVQVNAIFRRIAKELPTCKVGYHVHNISGWATANVLSAVDAGACYIEGSICGLGGGIAMPTSIASVGNLPSEDLVSLFEAMGIDTGMNTDVAVKASRDIAQLLGISPRSHAALVGTRSELRHQAENHPKYHPT